MSHDTYIQRIVGKLNQKMPTFLRHLRHCIVSMLEISLEEIDQMPMMNIRCQSVEFDLLSCSCFFFSSHGKLW